MDFSLTEAQKHVYQSVCEASEALNQSQPAGDPAQAFSRERWQQCADAGLTGLGAPRELGGQGLSALETTAALEAFGYACDDSGLVFSVCAHLLACVVPLVRFGTDEQKQHYVPRLCDGTLIGANAISEAGSGSDAMALQTIATEDADEIVIDGAKVFITNGPVADLIIVFAALKTNPGRVMAVLLESDLPGVTRGQAQATMGLRTTAIGGLSLESVRVGRSAVLGQAGAALTIFQTAMNWERTCLFAAHLGTAQRILEKAIERAQTRERFGRPIKDFQAISHPLVDRHVQIEAARLLVYKAASRLDSGHIDPTWAAMAKVAVSEAYVQTTQDAVQVFGGDGFMTETGLEEALRDAVGSRIYSGANEVLKNFIGRWIGL